MPCEEGEARNTLTRAVCIHRLGRFPTRSIENQAVRVLPLSREHPDITGDSLRENEAKLDSNGFRPLLMPT